MEKTTERLSIEFMTAGLELLDRDSHKLLKAMMEILNIKAATEEEEVHPYPLAS